MTSYYSLLQGNGILGDNGHLRPTQRLYNLLQLATIHTANVYVTNAIQNAEKSKVMVSQGIAEIDMPAESFITVLFSAPDMPALDSNH